MEVSHCRFFLLSSVLKEAKQALPAIPSAQFHGSGCPTNKESN